MRTVTSEQTPECPPVSHPIVIHPVPAIAKPMPTGGWGGDQHFEADGRLIRKGSSGKLL